MNTEIPGRDNVILGRHTGRLAKDSRKLGIDTGRLTMDKGGF